MTTDPFTPRPAASTPTVRSRRRMPLWVTLLIGGAVGLVLLGVGFVLYVVAAFSGGFDDLISFGKPQSDDRAVVRAGDAAERDVDALHRRLAQQVALADTGVRVAWRDCQTGQHNFKIDDPYDLDCSTSRGSVLAVDSGTSANAAVEAEIARLDALLVGWQREQAPAPSSARVEPGARWTRGGDPLGEAGVQQVSLQVLTRHGRGVPAYALGPYGSTITRDGREVDPEVALTGGRYAVLTVSERYFYD